MNHTTIDDESLVERYLLGRLTVAEKQRFEAHFVDCPRCLEQLEWTEDLRGALRAAAAEDAAGTVVTGGILAFLARRGRAARALLAFAVLVAPVALAFFLPRVQSLEQRAASAEQAVTVAQDRLARQTKSRQAAAEGAPDDLRRRLAELEQQAAEERRRREQTEQRLAELRRPEVNVAAILLGVVVRGGDPGRPATPLKVSERQRVVLEVDAEAAFESYRASLFDATGIGIWQDHLRPNPWALLEITFPAGFLEPGDHRLELAGLDAGGRATELGSFLLRAEP